jgi:hypothetical protein
VSTIFETAPGEVSGTALQAERLEGGQLRLTVTYPVSIGGQSTERRPVGVVLDAAGEAGLRAALAPDVADALTVLDAVQTADVAFLHRVAIDYGPDSTPAANLNELLALRKLAAAVRASREG